MNLRSNSLALLSLVSVAGLGSLAIASLIQPAPPAAAATADGETEIKVAELPDAARAAVTKLVPAANVKKVIKESDEGITTFEIEYTDGSTACSIVVSPAGDVLETERGIGQDKVTAAAMAALKKEFPGATLGDAMLVTKTYFEVVVTIDGKKHEVKVDAAGNIDDAHGGGKEEAEKSEKSGEKHADKD